MVRLWYLLCVSPKWELIRKVACSRFEFTAYFKLFGIGVVSLGQWGCPCPRNNAANACERNKTQAKRNSRTAETCCRSRGGNHRLRNLSAKREKSLLERIRKLSTRAGGQFWPLSVTTGELALSEGAVRFHSVNVGRFPRLLAAWQFQLRQPEAKNRRRA